MGRCSICGTFQKDGWKIANTPDEPFASEFPAEFGKLIGEGTPPDPECGLLFTHRDQATLTCPECGLMYTYTRHLPGGSEDAMVTWIVERVEPLVKHGRHRRKELPPK